MLVKNLIFYQNLNRSLKYRAKSPFKMYKNVFRGQILPNFPLLFYPSPGPPVLLGGIAYSQISTLPTTPSTRKRALAFCREAKTPRSCCLHCQK